MIQLGLSKTTCVFSGASIGCLFTGIVLKSYEATPDNSTTINQTASILRETLVHKSCGVDFCLNKEKEENLYSIVHFNNFSVGAIPPSPRPEEETENLFGTTPVGYVRFSSMIFKSIMSMIIVRHFYIY